jgi:hypothetical protein
MSRTSTPRFAFQIVRLTIQVSARLFRELADGKVLNPGEAYAKAELLDHADYELERFLEAEPAFEDGSGI